MGVHLITAYKVKHVLYRLFLITKDCKEEVVSYAAYVQVKTVFIHRTLHRQTTHLWKTGFSVCGGANHKPF